MFFAQAEQDAGSSLPSAEVFDQFPSLVESIKADVPFIIPELILCVGVCWVILADLFGSEARTRRLGYHAIAFCASALLALFTVELDYRSYFGNMAVHDTFGVFFKALILLGTMICIPMVMMHRSFEKHRMGEFYGLLLAAVVGMFLMVSAKNLLMFYLGIEFASITCYLLTAYVKQDRGASEGALKYVIYGSVASGAMIYGLSILYGLTGTLDAAALADELVVKTTVDTTLILAGMLSFAGFAYKISAFPMHFWCPDVYEGAPAPFTAFLAVVSKSAGFAVFMRFVWAFTSGGESWDMTLLGGSIITMNWPLLLSIAAALSMTVGNLAALFQTNIKRMFAYSSIAHAGYLLMGVVALIPTSEGGAGGYSAVAFYLTVYLFMNLGAFLIVTIIGNRTGNDLIESYRGLGTRNNLLAVSLLVILVSLIGLPPTGGFTGKMQLLGACIDSGYVWLAVVAGINSAISVYYYARIIKLMFLNEAEEGSQVVLPRPTTWFVVAMVVPIIYFGVFPNSTIELMRGLEISIG